MLMHNPPILVRYCESAVWSRWAFPSRRRQRPLGVNRKTLSAVLNGKAGISPERAIRLSIAFDTSAGSG